MFHVKQFEKLAEYCLKNGIRYGQKEEERFEAFYEFLIEKNKVMNLTAVTEPEEVELRHYIDSVSSIPVLKELFGDRLSEEPVKGIDLGTGAGFPGIPLKIMRPDIKLTLLDSLNKRLIFLDEVSKALGISTELIHARAEEYSRKEEYRDSFDIAVSRAVANLPALCEYCLPYVKTGGCFIAMKGPDGENELSLSANALKQLCAEKESSVSLTLPDQSTRTIITLRKLSQTPAKYPRRGIKISKSPL